MIQDEKRQVDDVISYGVASVFTPPSNRGKGYASHMMRLLHWVLAPRSTLPSSFPEQWGLPPDPAGMGDARFSILYSDVGEGFYSECGPDFTPYSGWISASVMQTTLDIFSDMPIEASVSGQQEWLTKEEVNEVWKIDAALMKSDVARTPPNNKAVFACLPDLGVASFSIDRTMKFTADLRPVLPLALWGVRLSGPSQNQNEDASLTFATWTLDTQSITPIVIVTRLRATRITFPILMSKLVEAAQKAQAKRIDIWNLPAEFQPIAHAIGGKTWRRDEHLASFKWYGAEKSDEIEWLFNERYCWC